MSRTFWQSPTARAAAFATITTLLALILIAPGATSAASSSVVVTSEVPTATELSVTACNSDVFNVTSFGTVIPGEPARTTGGCAVTFSSSNHTAYLQLGQSDGMDAAMHQMSTGAIDPTFGTLGITTTEFLPSTDSTTFAGIDAQRDGKVVTASGCAVNPGDDFKFCVQRLLSDGTPDTTFNGDGQLTIDILADSDAAYDVQALDNGKILVTGRCMEPGDTRSCVVRLNSNGTLDTTFSSDGIADINNGPGVEVIWTSYHPKNEALALEDGRILLARTCTFNGATEWHGCYVRLQENGELDLTFGTGGYQTNELPGVPLSAVQTAGQDNRARVYSAGDCSTVTPGVYDVCFTRLLNNGSLDPSFGTSGVASVTIPGIDSAFFTTIIVRPDGRIQATGVCAMTALADSHSCAVQITPAGVLDTTFDGDGFILQNYVVGDIEGFTDSVLQPDGKTLYTHLCKDGISYHDMCIQRRDPSGVLDTTFGTAGQLRLVQGPSDATEILSAVSLGIDGEIFAAGMCGTEPVPGTPLVDQCVLNLSSSGTVANYDNGNNDWDDGNSFFGVCMRTLSVGVNDWDTSGSCPATDGTNWNELPETMTTVAHLPVGAGSSTATFDFGVKFSDTQNDGTYVAPIQINVISPNI